MQFVYVVTRDDVPIRARSSMESAKEAADRLFPVLPEHQNAKTEWRLSSNGEAMVFLDPKTNRMKLARLAVIRIPFKNE